MCVCVKKGWTVKDMQNEFMKKDDNQLQIASAGSCFKIQKVIFGKVN